MKTEVIDRNGVKLAGPDSPALADRDAVVLAPVGAVCSRQAGILDYAPTQAQANTVQGMADTGQIAATSVVSARPNAEMIDRAHAAAPGLDRGTVEDIVYAALGLRKHPLTDAAG